MPSIIHIIFSMKTIVLKAYKRRIDVHDDDDDKVTTYFSNGKKLITDCGCVCVECDRHELVGVHR